jgi:hypothetical protein
MDKVVMRRKLKRDRRKGEGKEMRKRGKVR